MRLEKWFISNLDDSQRNIIVQNIDKSIAVRGAAGSGKTNLAIHRALQAKNKGSYAILIFTIALKRMIAYGMDALGLDKERIAYEWAWTHRGFDLNGDVYCQKNPQNGIIMRDVLFLVNDMDVRKFVRTNETLTVEQFKAAHNVSRIDVKKNPKTGKLFFTYGAKTGAVALKGIPQHPMLSYVSGSDGARFWLLHEAGEGGAPVLRTSDSLMVLTSLTG